MHWFLDSYIIAVVEKHQVSVSGSESKRHLQTSTQRSSLSYITEYSIGILLLYKANYQVMSHGTLQP